jgi:hypothetical protein
MGKKKKMDKVVFFLDFFEIIYFLIFLSFFIKNKIMNFKYLI